VNSVGHLGTKVVVGVIGLTARRNVTLELDANMVSMVTNDLNILHK